MAIRVVNKKTNTVPIDFMCDRTSPLGNPFKMRNLCDRERVISLFHKYFYANLNPDRSTIGFLEYLDEILQAAKTRDITLGCWCAPEPCHCDVIKEYLDVEIAINFPPTDQESTGTEAAESIDDIIMHLVAQSHEREEDRWASLIEYIRVLEEKPESNIPVYLLDEYDEFNGLSEMSLQEVEASLVLPASNAIRCKGCPQNQLEKPNACPSNWFYCNDPDNSRAFTIVRFRFDQIPEPYFSEPPEWCLNKGDSNGNGS